jgi:hypothetical protein
LAVRLPDARSQRRVNESSHPRREPILGVTICLLYCLTRAVYGKAFLKVLNILPYLEFLKRYGTITDLIVKFQIFRHVIWFYLAGQ